MTGWPEYPEMHPHLFANLLRHCVTALSYIKRKSKKAIAPIKFKFWVKHHILHSLQEFVRCVFNLTLTALTLFKLAGCSLLQRLKRLHFKKPKSILQDPERGANRISEATDNRVLSEVDGAVENYISSLNKKFAKQYHQQAFRITTNDWKSGMYVRTSRSASSPLTKRVTRLQ